jgi:MFS family permease
MNTLNKIIQNKETKEIRCTAFEYSHSSSDSEEEKEKEKKTKTKISFPLLNLKKFKSSNKLVVGEKKPKAKKNNIKTKIYLSRYVRMLLFFLLIIDSVIIDLDAGIIVSSYKAFTQDLHMSDFQFGSLNSITTIGKILALLFYMLIINKNHRKFIVVTTSAFQGIGFFLYFINDNFYYIAFVKFITSISKVFINIYMPVWVDQFGIKKYKTILLTIVYMVTSYGRIVGAWIGTVLFNNEWKRAFVCCGFIFFVLSFSLFSIPQKYYSTKYMFVEQQKKLTGNVIEKLVPTKEKHNDKTDAEMEKDIQKMKDIEYIDEDRKSSSTRKKSEKLDKEEEKEEKNEKIDVDNNLEINEKDDKKEKLIYDYNTNTNDDNLMIKNLTLLGKLKIVIVNPCFLFSSLSRACIFFAFKIIHVFFKKYTFEALKYNDEITFFYYYSLTTILAPSLGSLVGGAICNKFLGGYESRNSIWIIILFGTAAVGFISLTRITEEFNYLIIYIFGFFFSVSAFLPTISGYIINSLHKKLKGFGSSFDSLITNVLGKLPSPIVYGIINDKYKNEDPKFAWNTSLATYYIGTVFIYLTCFFKWRMNSRKSKSKNNVVQKTMKYVHLNKSRLVKAEKPIPKYDAKKTYIPTELEDMDGMSSTVDRTDKNNKENKKRLLNQLKQKESNQKNTNEI